MRTPDLSDAQIEALVSLTSCWGTEKFALIGAQALTCFIDLQWRETRDLDVTVCVTLEDYPAGLDGQLGWRRNPRIPHQWHSPGGVRVDALPSHPDTLAEGTLQWPGDNRVMNLSGLRLVNDFAERHEVAPGIQVRVPPMSVLAVLKMTAYLDRPAERARDLQDLLHVLRSYPDDTDNRRFEDSVYDLELTHEQSGPYVLGQEIVALDLTSDENRVVTMFLDTLCNDHVALGIMAREIGALIGTNEVIPYLEGLLYGLGTMGSQHRE